MANRPQLSDAQQRIAAECLALLAQIALTDDNFRQGNPVLFTVLTDMEGVEIAAALQLKSRSLRGKLHIATNGLLVGKNEI